MFFSLKSIFQISLWHTTASMEFPDTKAQIHKCFRSLASCVKFPARFPILHGCSGKKFAVASIFEWRGTGAVEKKQRQDIHLKSCCCPEVKCLPSTTEEWPSAPQPWVRDLRQHKLPEPEVVGDFCYWKRGRRSAELSNSYTSQLGGSATLAWLYSFQTKARVSVE